MTRFGYGMPTQTDEDPVAAAEHQKRRVEDFYRYRLGHLGWAGVFIDGPESACMPLLCRAAGQQMLERAQRNDHIILVSLSVSFHRRRDLLHLLDYARMGGLVLHFIEEHVEIGGRTAAEAVGGVLRALDRSGDEPRRRAIKKTLDERRQGGLPKNDEAPIGFKLTGEGANQQLVPDEQERAVMRRIYELRRPAMSFDEIRQFLRRDGVTFRRKVRGNWQEREWSESRIRRAHAKYLELGQSQKDAVEPRGLSAAAH